MLASSLLGALVGAAALVAPPAGASLLAATFTACDDSFAPVAPGDAHLNVTSVFATMMSGEESEQLQLNGAGNDVLRLNLFGHTTKNLSGYNTENNRLVTLFATTTVAGIQQYGAKDYLCNSLFPAKLSEPYQPGVTYCPLPAGPFGLNVSVPLYNVHELATVNTQIHVVDANEPARTLVCVNVHVTPYVNEAWPYRLFLWLPAGIAMAYWITTWAARFAAGWVVGADRTGTPQREATMLKWGTMLISGLSGERLGVSSAVLRFVTPGLRDILHHIQFVTMLAMLAVNWPQFFYPIVGQCAWADLVWNVTIVSDKHPSVYPHNYTSPSEFDYMTNDPKYPLYMNASAPHRLLDLDNTPNGLESFARIVGLRPQDLFGTCLSLFLMLTAGICFVSLVLWLAHCLTELFSSDLSRKPVATKPTANRNSIASTSMGGHSHSNSAGKEWFDARRASIEFSQLPITATQAPIRPVSRATAPSKIHRVWKRFSPKGEAGAFHVAALYGNLLRLILTFHFPITVFSIYQLSLPYASIVSRVFAALAFVFISVLIPAGVMYKVSRTPTGKLYDAARTLLSLGTVYNVYEQEKQLYRALPIIGSVVSGIVVAAGQKSGLAQTIILVVVELATFIVTTAWSPWGQGAGMGAHVVFLAITRIASIIMAMILSKEINIDDTGNQWITYVILIIQGIVFVYFFLMILTKIVEGLIRLFGRAPFDESTHPIDGGIFAAIMDLDCFNGVRGGKAAARKRRKMDSRALQRNVSVAGSLTTQMMLDRHSQGVERTGYPGLVEANPNARGGSYFPVTNPSVDQFGRRSMSDAGSMLSISEENRGGIMDAWRPINYGDAAPLTSPSEKTTPLSSPRQHQMGWGSQPPAIRVTHGDGPYNRSGHSRAHSSAAIIEELDTPSETMTSLPIRSLSTSPRLGSYPVVTGAPVYPPVPGAIRSDKNGVRPPPLMIPRRRSLNNIAVEAEDEQPVRRSGSKRRSWGSANWFNRATEPGEDDDSASDEEPGPSGRRRRANSDAEARPRGWRAIFSRKSAMTDRARDENYARKTIAVNESGAALAGVANPTPEQPAPGGSRSFNVRRKGPPTSAGPRSADGGGGNSATPLLAPPTQPSFRVRRDIRPGHRPSAANRMSDAPSIASHAALVPSPTPSDEAASFRVSRRSPGGSALSSPNPSLTLHHMQPQQLASSGYGEDLFVPLGSPPRI